MLTPAEIIASARFAKEPPSITENEFGMCEVLLYLFPPREGGLGSGDENL